MNSENLTKLSKKKSQNNLRIITERNFQKKKYKKDGGISNQFLENILKMVDKILKYFQEELLRKYPQKSPKEFLKR